MYHSYSVKFKFKFYFKVKSKIKNNTNQTVTYTYKHQYVPEPVHDVDAVDAAVDDDVNSNVAGSSLEYVGI